MTMLGFVFNNCENNNARQVTAPPKIIHLHLSENIGCDKESLLLQYA
jgi:hypothetical protein